VGVFHPRSVPEFVLMLALYPSSHQVNPNGKIIALKYKVKGDKVNMYLRDAEHDNLYDKMCLSH
jgi:hypothetical protein